MELDAHTAGDVVIHQVIELDQMLSIDLSREINLGRMFVSLSGRNPLDANNRACSRDFVAASTGSSELIAAPIESAPTLFNSVRLVIVIFSFS